MRNIILLITLSLASVHLQGQNNAITQFNNFRQQVHKDYSDFRRKCNAEYADFLRKAWQSYEVGPVLNMPEENPVPPVIMSQEDKEKSVSPKPIPIDTVITPVRQETQPKPVTPIYERTQPTENRLSFTFFGTEGLARIPRTTNALTSLNGKLNEEMVANAWEALSNGDYDNMVRDCLEMRIRYRLCDWAYLLMLRELSEKYCGGRNNAATMLMGWLYCQTGYQMRLAIASQRLYLLFGTKHQIFGQGCYSFDDSNFYPLLHEGEEYDDNVQISGPSFPDEKPMSLYINDALALAENMSDTRNVKSKRYSNVSITFCINRNLTDFYNTYPTSVLGENFCTRWAMYANTPMADNVKSSLYPQLQRCISGLSQIDAVNVILNWVQTGFVYEYDDKVWGHDRAFFAEESLMYPYCDCEDRSILFTRIIRDLLGLRCILIYYPGHLASAVCFTEQVNGDYIMLNGMRFIVTDPTYIGAPAGYTMPGMDNKSATVILLN